MFSTAVSVTGVYTDGRNILTLYTMYNPESVSTRGVHVKRDVVIIHFIQLHPPGVIKYYK